MEFSRQEYWSGWPFSSLGDIPNPGIKPVSLVSSVLADRFFTTEPPGKPGGMILWKIKLLSRSDSCLGSQSKIGRNIGFPHNGLVLMASFLWALSWSGASGHLLPPPTPLGYRFLPSRTRGQCLERDRSLEGPSTFLHNSIFFARVSFLQISQNLLVLSLELSFLFLFFRVFFFLWGSGENGYMYMYSWTPLLLTWNCHSVVNRLHPNTKCFWC